MGAAVGVLDNALGRSLLVVSVIVVSNLVRLLLGPVILGCEFGVGRPLHRRHVEVINAEQVEVIDPERA